MATKIGYTPTSIFAAGCGAIATSAAMTNPATAPFAGGIGTAASAVAGGVELNDKEKNIKDNLNQAMDKAWETIDKKYRLSLHTEKYTDNYERTSKGYIQFICFLEFRNRRKTLIIIG